MRLPGFIRDYSQFTRNIDSDKKRFSLAVSDLYPCLNDKTETTDFDPHYIYHLSWGARLLSQINPIVHVDISSSLYFSTIISAFIPVAFFDYRPANIHLSNFSSGAVCLTALPFKDNTIPSLSCMHTIEHIGLGRYGDTIDPEGDLKAIGELVRVLSKEGDLLFVVPIGKPKIEFNAHRIYSYEQILEYFKGLKLMEFSLIPDNATKLGIISSVSGYEADIQKYGCGCFWFRK